MDRPRKTDESRADMSRDMLMRKRSELSFVSRVDTTVDISHGGARWVRRPRKRAAENIDCAREVIAAFRLQRRQDQWRVPANWNGVDRHAPRHKNSLCARRKTTEV
jgi:hypothetical protein